MVRWWWLEKVLEFVEDLACVIMFCFNMGERGKGEDSGVTICFE